MPEFWMCLINNVRELSNILGWMQYIALHKTTEQLSRQTYSEQCQTIMMERLQKKKKCLSAGAHPNIFQDSGVEGLWDFGTLVNISSKTQENEAPERKILEIFLPDTLKTTFWMENLTQRWTQSGLFFPKYRHFFRFSKRAGKTSPLHPSCMPENTLISLNLPEYPLKSFNKLVYARALKYGWSSYMFERLLKMPWVLRKPWFSIWHGCICEGYVSFKYVWLWLHTPQ